MPPIIINPPKKIEAAKKRKEKDDLTDAFILKCVLSFLGCLIMVIIVIVCPGSRLAWFKVTCGYTGPEESKIKIYEYTDMVEDLIWNIDAFNKSNHDYIDSLYNTYDDFDKSATQFVDYMKKFCKREWYTNKRIRESRLTWADRAYRGYYPREASKFDVPEDDNKEKYFMNGITAIIDKMDQFINNEKEYIDKLDKSDEDLKELHKKMNQFLANGRQFIKTAMEIRKKTDDDVDN